MKESVTAGSRYTELDNAKGILIVCVILGHVLERIQGYSFLAPRIQLWIYLFHMPAFIFIAGLFAKKTVKEHRYDRAFSYLLLFYFMKALFFLTNVYIKGAGNVIFDPFCENDIPWFCLSMFWWLLTAILVRRLSPVIVTLVSVAFSVAAGYFPLDPSYLVVLRSLTFFPFFYLGYAADLSALLLFLKKRWVQAAGGCILAISLLIILVFYNDNRNYIMLFRGVCLYNEMGSVFFRTCDGWSRLAAFFISLLLLLALLAVSSGCTRLFSGIGRCTLPVFVFHGPLVYILFNRFHIMEKGFSRHAFAGSFLLSFLILAVTMLPPLNRFVTFLTGIPVRVRNYLVNIL